METMKEQVKDKVKTEDEQPEPPNIAFIGNRENAGVKDVGPGDIGFLPREPITSFSDGMKTTRLPTAVDQKKPFFHKDASIIVRLFPKLYKPYVEKGRN